MRCTQSGRECEGYERYPTFLNRTAAGLERRKPLEEVKLRGTIPAESSIAGSSRGQGQASLHPPTVYGRHPSPIGQPDTTQALNQQIFANFLEVYCPSAVHLPHSWFHMVPTMQDPGNALLHGANAFAASRLAFVNNDENMKLRAFDAYGKALRELQKALWDPNAMYRDETLAATRALVIFEVRSLISLC